MKTIQKAKKYGFQVSLVFFWLDSVKLAINRVQTRVLEGGHNIPESVIIRRYTVGIKNLFELYLPICNYWMIFENSVSPAELIAEGYTEGEFEILNESKLEKIKKLKHDQGK